MSQQRSSVCCLLLAVLAAVVVPTLADETWFQPVGFLQEFPIEIENASTGISPDGAIAVGRDVSHVGFEAWRWTPDGGLVGLGDLPGSPALNSQATDVSNTGVIVGVGAFNSDMQQAFRWTEATGMVGLGALPEGTPKSIARSISNDGSVIVGESGDGVTNSLPFLWTADTGMVSLGLPPGFWAAFAQGVSPDGAVVVGDGGILPFGYGSWRWTDAEGFIDLGSLGGAFPFTRAQGISADGQVIVGNGYGPSGFEAFRWTADDGIVGLGDLPGGTYASWANGGVSHDGSIIVGGSTSAEYFSDAFIWDAENGMRSLKHVLEDEYGLDLTGWNLEEAMGLSDDGRTISGWGYNPLGQREGWVAHMAEPIVLPLDIKPGSCPNPLNRGSHGLFPAAVLGTTDYDVADIDVSTVEIARADGVGGAVGPQNAVYEDVGTPFDGEACDCHELGSDGIMDLLLKF
jgi:probable HAF family extracellular repeat protein